MGERARTKEANKMKEKDAKEGDSEKKSAVLSHHILKFLEKQRKQPRPMNQLWPAPAQKQTEVDQGKQIEVRRKEEKQKKQGSALPCEDARFFLHIDVENQGADYLNAMTEDNRTWYWGQDVHWHLKRLSDGSEWRQAHFWKQKQRKHEGERINKRKSEFAYWKWKSLKRRNHQFKAENTARVILLFKTLTGKFSISSFLLSCFHVFLVCCSCCWKKRKLQRWIMCFWAEQESKFQKFV